MVSIISKRAAPGSWLVTWQFENEAFETLRTLAQVIQFKASERIFREGEPSDGMYLILSGTATVVRRSMSGDERIVGKLEAGNSFGEIGLLVASPRHATVIASTTLSAMKITAYALELLQNSAPDIAAMIYKALARSMAEQLMASHELRQPE